MTRELKKFKMRTEGPFGQLRIMRTLWRCPVDGCHYATAEDRLLVDALKKGVTLARIMDA